VPHSGTKWHTIRLYTSQVAVFEIFVVGKT
jgi:hypothetical protein